MANVNLENVVREVMEQMKAETAAKQAGTPLQGNGFNNGGSSFGQTNQLGIYSDVNQAIEAAAVAQKEVEAMDLEERKKLTDAIRAHCINYVEDYARGAVEETGMGNFTNKVEKNETAINLTPSVEDLPTEVFSGDDGVTLVELAPYGVIGAITPSTNPTETVICNGIGMIAAGNSVVFSPHPGAERVTNLAVTHMNEAIINAGGPRNLIVSLSDPSLDKTDVLLSHPKIGLLVATGGPGVVNAVLSSGKPSIGAAAGNPPAVVDETADIEKAVEDIIAGASYDNNLPCTAEKETIVAAGAYDYFMHTISNNPKAYVLRDRAKIEELTKLVILPEGGPNKEFTGKDATLLLNRIGVNAPESTQLIVMETEFSHPLVQTELLMPIMPVVKARDADHAIDLAVEAEQGNRHTAVCHSKNIDVLTRMAQEIDTTIFVANAPSFAGLGVTGEGHTTYTVAGATGEGITSTKTFTRRRRVVLADSFNVK